MACIEMFCLADCNGPTGLDVFLIDIWHLQLWDSETVLLTDIWHLQLWGTEMCNKEQ